MDINKTLAEEFKLRREQIDNTVSLIDDGKTIPFIARYRKEMTGSLDDQVIREISERLTYLRNLTKRKEEVSEAIEAAGAMTPEIEAALSKAVTLVEVEDIYRPYRPKRKTRGSIARERGLETLAAFILLQQDKVSPLEEAERFINAEKGVESAEAALQGAMDIIAEDVSDDAELRKKLRELMNREAVLSVKASDAEKESVYQNYYDFSEPVKKIPGHRILAIDRGEKEDFLKASVVLPDGIGERLATDKYVKGAGECAGLVKAACEDGYKRLIYPSVEREIRNELTERAAEQAIKVFSSNLRRLLMQPPVKGSVTLGFDPGYRTGCKVAVVDDTGKVLDTGVVYPTTGEQRKIEQAKVIITGMIKKHGVTVIAIGNGTASRESEQFIAGVIKEIAEPKASYMVVSEAGASVYSASKLAAAEFPEYDVSLRSAVSIARRLQDPLAELVKIDPKAIGVGQYQHDMPKVQLETALDGVVEDCVNSVGVDLNTASHSLLSHIAGINAAVAKNIVAYREENGSFPDRKTLLKVDKLGKKAYEQCAGFLRIPGGKNPLDNTAVHPESYQAAQKLLEECGFKLSDLKNSSAEDIAERAERIGYIKLSEETGVGVPTLKDITKELQKPGRDPRDELPPPLLRSGDIMELKDLKPGMELVGTVRNIVDFGCFVDIGVHEDGLVHISQICNRYIKHPLEAVKVGEVVKVRVLDVDVKKKRIALTMKPEQLFIMNGGSRLEFIVPHEWDGKTAEEYLKKEQGISRRLITKLKRIPLGIQRNGELLRTVDIIRGGDRVIISLDEEGKALAPNGSLLVPVVYETEDFVVFNKPAGMPVHPSIRHYDDTLGNYFSYLYPKLSFRPVNRLDRDTSGLCFVAKNAHAAHWFSGRIEKTYYAVAGGEITKPGKIDAPIGRLSGSVILRCVCESGQRAVTHYEPIKRENGNTLLKIRLETGRTHQIRVHFSHIGFPLLGDGFYGGNCTHIKRQALHCGGLTIPKKDGGKIEVEADLPEDIKSCLGKNSE